MPRGMSKKAVDFLNVAYGKEGSLDAIFHTVTSYPEAGAQKAGEHKKPIVNMEYLIDATQYGPGEDPASVPFRNKYFIIFKKDDSNLCSVEQKTADELLAAQRPEGEAYREIPKPKLTGFSWLRHKLSWLFGEPEAYKAYERQKERQKEVASAKKAQMIEEKYGYKMVYDKDLADAQKAQNYIGTGRKVVEQQQVNIGKQQVSIGQSQVNIGQPQVDNSQPQVDNSQPQNTGNEVKPGTAARERVDAKVAADKTKLAARLLETLFGEKSTNKIYDADPVVVNALKDALLKEPTEPEDKQAQKDLATYILALQPESKDLEDMIVGLEFREASCIENGTHIDVGIIFDEVRNAASSHTVFHTGWCAAQPKEEGLSSSSNDAFVFGGPDNNSITKGSKDLIH